MRASIPLPPACKAGALPFELIPLKNATITGFEPARAEPNGLAVHRLNHSATSSLLSLKCCVKVKTILCFMLSEKSKLAA